MFTTKLRVTTLPVLMTGILVVGGVLIYCGPHGYTAPAQEASKVPKELLEKRRDAAARVWKRNLLRLKSIARALPRDLFGWSERWLEAELALCDKKKDRLALLKAHVERTREVERLATGYAMRGAGNEADAEAATYERINAEIRYFQVVGEAPPPPPPGLEKLTPPPPTPPPPGVEELTRPVEKKKQP